MHGGGSEKGGGVLLDFGRVFRNFPNFPKKITNFEKKTGAFGAGFSEKMQKNMKIPLKNFFRADARKNMKIPLKNFFRADARKKTLWNTPKKLFSW